MNWQEYTEKTDSIDWLKAHRDWVERNKWGFGDRALHAMWCELCQELPDNAQLMEIGVYRGQTISLWRLISDVLGKNFRVTGLTPLEATADKYHQHEPHQYFESIIQIHDAFGLKHPSIIKGLSTDSAMWELGPKKLDLLFIDGSHDEPDVRSDIEHFTPRVKPGGLVVIDDASCTLPDFGHWYKGLEDVSRVVDEFAHNKDFKEQERCGYVRIFKRV